MSRSSKLLLTGLALMLSCVWSMHKKTTRHQTSVMLKKTLATPADECPKAVRKRTYSDAFEMVFGIGTIFFPAVFRKSVTSMSTVSVKGVLEKQRQEKLKSSIGSVLSSNSCKTNMHESNMQTDSMSATDNGICLYSSPSMVSYKLTT